jgi:hypothetical protein
MGIRNWWHRRKVRRLFAKYVSPEVLDRIESGRSPITGPTTQHFQFVIVHIDEAKPDRVSQIFANIIDCFFRHHAVLASSSPSLIVGALGFVYPQYDSPELRKRLVRDLLDENGKMIRVAHGQADALAGIFGSGGYFSYSVLIPDFSGTLKRLFERPFGSAIEID